MSLSKFRRDVGVSAPTVWRWRKEGRLRTTNISGRLFVLPEHLQEFNTRAAAGEFARIIVTPKTAAA